MRNNKVPNFVRNVQGESYSLFNMTSPFQNVSVAFNWLNTEFSTPHTHEHWELFVNLSGKALHRINGCEMVMEKGSAFIIRPNDLHSIHKISDVTDETYEHINFIIKNDFMKKLLEIYGSYDNILNMKDYVDFKLDDFALMHIYERALLAQNLSRSEYEQQSKLLVSYLLVKYFEQKSLSKSEYPDWLNEFIMYISSPMSFDKNVQQLAANTSYSYSRLARIFKEYTGDTIVNFVTGKKMVYAKRLLRSTELSTLQISNKLGYASLSSFNHLFKSTFGITPSEYRRSKIEERKRMKK